MKSKVFSLLLAAALALSACSFPSGDSPDAAYLVQTAAASTVSAQLTESAILAPTATETPAPTTTSTATQTSAITNTPVPTTSSGGGGVNPACDSMAFVSDVTIPDGTDMAPDATFTKTWRIRNSGTCSWSTSYSAVFSSGAAMGGPATQPLTATIAPNSTIDISVNLTAPSTPGTHTGYWMLRNASGQTFGSFYVIIDVVGAGGSGTGTTFIAAQVGQVNASSGPSGSPHTGSDGTNGIQAFAQFDLSSIPNGSTITQVTVDFSKFDTVSDPFAAMGCLRAIPGSYFPLDAGDYNVSTSGADIEWCSFSALATSSVSENVKTRAQAALGGSKLLEYRIAFSGSPAAHQTLARFLTNGLKLIITYTEP